MHLHLQHLSLPLSGYPGSLWDGGLTGPKEKVIPSLHKSLWFPSFCVIIIGISASHISSRQKQVLLAHHFHWSQTSLLWYEGQEWAWTESQYASKTLQQQDHGLSDFGKRYYSGVLLGTRMNVAPASTPEGCSLFMENLAAALRRGKEKNKDTASEIPLSTT